MKKKYTFSLTPVPAIRTTQRQKGLLRAKPGSLSHGQAMFADRMRRYEKYKVDMAFLAKAQRFKFPEAFAGITFYMPTDKQGRWNSPHQMKPDLDNLLKGLKDALCKDDSYIWHYGYVRKLWAKEGSIEIDVLTEVLPVPTTIENA